MDTRQPPDPKVPSFTGAGGYMEFKQWSRLAKAYALSLGEQEGSAGPRLLLNLRGQAEPLAQDVEPETLVDDDDIFDDAGVAVDPAAARPGSGR